METNPNRGKKVTVLPATADSIQADSIQVGDTMSVGGVALRIADIASAPQGGKRLYFQTGETPAPRPERCCTAQ